MFNAQKYMEKFGWSKGKGMGKREDGIATYIHAVKKDDQKGVGLRNEPAVSPEWDDIFKRAAANIDIVNDTEKGVKFSSKQKNGAEAPKQLVYDRFRSGPADEAPAATEDAPVEGGETEKQKRKRERRAARAAAEAAAAAEPAETNGHSEAAKSKKRKRDKAAEPTDAAVDEPVAEAESAQSSRKSKKSKSKSTAEADDAASAAPAEPARKKRRTAADAEAGTDDSAAPAAAAAASHDPDGADEAERRPALGLGAGAHARAPAGAGAAAKAAHDSDSDSDDDGAAAGKSKIASTMYWKRSTGKLARLLDQDSGSGSAAHAERMRGEQAAALQRQRDMPATGPTIDSLGAVSARKSASRRRQRNQTIEGSHSAAFA